MSWSQYRGNVVAIHSSEDAIIPTWVYMLLSAHISPYAAFVSVGTLEEVDKACMEETLSKIDFSMYKDKKLMLKGCSAHIPSALYASLTRLAMPYASSIMYGEPCSSVPVFKQKK